MKMTVARVEQRDEFNPSPSGRGAGVRETMRQPSTGSPTVYAAKMRTPFAILGIRAGGANPIALVIPCHRVVGSQGSLGGFMGVTEGEPIAIKRWLLTHEGYRFGA